MIDYTTPPVAAFREELWKFWKGEENNIGQAGHDLLAFIDAMNKPTDEPRGNGEYGEVFGKPAAERSECKATPCAVPEGYALVPVAELAAALDAVDGVMQDAYNRGHQVCCGQGYSECCGNSIMEWGPADDAILSGLQPAHATLAAMLAAASKENNNG